MKAQELIDEDLLKSIPQKGQLFLKEARTLIFNADALGTLRKDLIHNLGIGRARGFLSRYGWQLGFNNAMNIKEEYHWDNDEEWIIAGPVLFTLQGFGKAEVDFLQVDRDNKKFLLKGRFINSVEAENHIRYFGHSEEPACWMLIGYASGYASAFFGEKIYYKETKCESKGDSHCEFEGKTLAQWASEIDDELPFYDDKTIRDELEIANKKINEQNTQLKKLLAIEQDLSQLVLNGEGLSGITETISSLIHRDVILFDSNFHLLTYNRSLDYELLNKFQQKLTKYLKDIRLSELKNMEQVRTVFPIETQMVIEKKSFNVVILAIVATNEILGFVSTVSRKFSNIECEAFVFLQRTAEIYALEILRHKQMEDLEQEYRADFIDTLFSQKYSNKTSLISWGQRLGINVEEPYYVIAMQFDILSLDNLRSEEIIKLKNQVIQDTSQLLKKYFPDIVCVNVQENIVILLPEKMMSKDVLKERLKEVISKFSNRYCNIIIGVGKVANDVEDYYKVYEQACKSLKVIKSFNKKELILFFDELGAISVFLNDNNDLVQYMEDKLSPLLEYDAKNNANLIETLDYYLTTESIRTAAKELSLSTSGMKYRLNTIKKFGYDLQSPNERFELQLAINVYKISQ